MNTVYWLGRWTRDAGGRRLRLTLDPLKTRGLSSAVSVSAVVNTGVYFMELSPMKWSLEV